MQTNAGGDALRPGGADASVRRATAADVPAIAAVQARALRAAYADLLDPQALAQLSPAVLHGPWEAAVIRPPTPGHVVLVACAAGAVVGVAAVAPSPDPDATAADGELTVLVVDPAHHRVGHGSRLLAAAVDLLAGAGAASVRTWTPATDEPRRGFLASAGLAPDGARRIYETSDGRRVSEVRLTASLVEVDSVERTSSRHAEHGA